MNSRKLVLSRHWSWVGIRYFSRAAIGSHGGPSRSVSGQAPDSAQLVDGAVFTARGSRDQKPGRATTAALLRRLEPRQRSDLHAARLRRSEKPKCRQSSAGAPSLVCLVGRAGSKTVSIAFDATRQKSGSGALTMIRFACLTAHPHRPTGSTRCRPEWSTPQPWRSSVRWPCSGA
jgi:hypothetical protein